MAKAKKTISTSIVKDIASLKGMTKVELMEELQTAQKEYYLLSMKHSLGELKQPHLITSLRKYKAQISTFMTTAL